MTGCVVITWKVAVIHIISTYRQFKRDTAVTEPYLIRVCSKIYRSALAIFRYGVALLQIETGLFCLATENSNCTTCVTELK